MFDLDYYSAYKRMFREDVKRILKSCKPSKPTVLHRMTCPCCDKKLVNLYFSASQDRYICKECLDKDLKRKERFVNGKF